MARLLRVSCSPMHRGRFIANRRLTGRSLLIHATHNECAANRPARMTLLRRSYGIGGNSLKSRSRSRADWIDYRPTQLFDYKFALGFGGDMFMISPASQGLRNATALYKADTDATFDRVAERNRSRSAL